MNTQDDLLHSPTGERFWHENYLFWGMDSGKNVSFMMHFTRMPFDPEMHRGMLLGYLPDDKLLLAKSVGRLRTPQATSPGTAAMWAECAVPFQTWHLRADCVGLLVDRKLALAQTLPDGPLVPIRVELTFEAGMLPWHVDGQKLAGQKWGSLRFEQGGAITGSISHGTASDPISVTHAITGAGYRDHSVGIRHEGKGGREATFITGVFPESGRAFGLLQLRAEDPWARGYVATRDTIEEVTSFDVPAWAGTDTVGQKTWAKFELGGKPQFVTGEILHGAPQMVESPSHNIFGHDRNGALRGRLLVDAPSRLWWDGEEGYGHDQRVAGWGKW